MKNLDCVGVAVGENLMIPVTLNGQAAPAHTTWWLEGFREFLIWNITLALKRTSESLEDIGVNGKSPRVHSPENETNISRWICLWNQHCGSTDRNCLRPRLARC